MFAGQSVMYSVEVTITAELESSIWVVWLFAFLSKGKTSNGTVSYPHYMLLAPEAIAKQTRGRKCSES